MRRLFVKRRIYDDLFSFFFSSRRRHTRWNCDWSSDVCSSDLKRVEPALELDKLRDAPFGALGEQGERGPEDAMGVADRKSTRLNSSHSSISYAVFCLKKKKK